MKNNLGKDMLWKEETWAGTDRAVLAEVGRIRVAQKVFPASHCANGANGLYVPVDAFRTKTDAAGKPTKIFPLSILEGQTRPYLEISFEFSLTQGQVADEVALKTGRTLARLAAKSVAQAEDLLFFQGKKVDVPGGVNVINKDSAEEGLVALAATPVVVPLIDKNKPGVYGEKAFAAVVEGISILEELGQPGPYALFLASAQWADTYVPAPNTLTTTADRLIPLLEGGFYGTGALTDRTGLLTSLGGEPTTLYVGQDATTAYTQQNNDGSASFRVFERVQIVAREPDAFVKLEFEGD